MHRGVALTKLYCSFNVTDCLALAVKRLNDFAAQVEGGHGNCFVSGPFSGFVDGAEDGEELTADWGETREWDACEVGR